MSDIRIIARLDVKGENVINTIQMEGLRVVGDPNTIAVKYYEQGIDEILIIDQVASLYQRGHLIDLTKKFAEHVFIPVTVGGGIISLEDARRLLRSGADKIAINTAITKKPNLLKELSEEFGSQSVVASIQAKKVSENKWDVFIDGGRENTGLDVFEWSEQLVGLGAGELLVTSIDRDGTRKGFEESLISVIAESVGVPVIASGGFGCPEHAIKLMKSSHCKAIAIADYLHMERGTLTNIKNVISNSGFSVRIENL